MATVDLQEIQRAKKFIESYGYETCLNTNRNSFSDCIE